MKLKDHPFAVAAFFERSLVFTFAYPAEVLSPLIPAPLVADTYQDKWTFLAIAMVQTRHLRPKGFPLWMGNDFFLVGYRLFVRYTDQQGKRKRGLYILKSATNRKKMEWLGNIFTHYQYSTTDITQQQHNGSLQISSVQSDFHITIDQQTENAVLPAGSPFTDWKDARKFAGPLPFTFTVNAQDQSILIVEGVRQNWVPRPVQVTDYHFDFLTHISPVPPVLANAFEINNIPYYWKKGVREKWM